MKQFYVKSSLLALIAASFGTPAFAQTTGDDEETSGIADIVVTAQRRSESVQDVPIAVAAFTGEMVEASGSADISDLNGIAPNVVIQTQGLVANVPMVSIRGMSTADPDPNADPKISTMVNGIYVPFVASNMLDLFDIERIEILKGPQGVLFGKNNLAGTINVFTAKPTPEFGGEVRATIGSFGLKQIKAKVNLGTIGEGVSAKVAATYRDYNGYARNVITGSKLHASENIGLRAAILVEPSDNFDSFLVFDWNKEDTVGPAIKLTNNGSAGYLALPLAVRNSIRLAAIPIDPFANTKSHGLAWTSNLKLGSGTLTAVLGYRKQDYLTKGDFDGLLTPVPGFEVTRDFSGHSKSAEVRYVSEEGKLIDYVIGLYAQGDKWNQFNTVLSTPTARTLSALGQKSSSYAVFALANIHPAEQLTLSAGGRYSWDKKNYSIATQVFANNVLSTANSFAGRFNESWKRFTPRFTVEFEPTDNAMIYASYSKGYKAGGFNSRGTRPENVGPYNPESVNAYEIGLKSDLFDRRVRFNLAAFLNKFKDMQFGVTRPGAVRPESVTTNVAAAETKGIEAEMTFQVTPEFTVGVNIGYLKGRYTDFCEDTDSALSTTTTAPLQCGPAVPVTFAGSTTVSYLIPTDGTGRAWTSPTHPRSAKAFRPTTGCRCRSVKCGCMPTPALPAGTIPGAATTIPIITGAA